MGRRSQIWHWRQEDEVKNFGDYLADFLSQEMFEPISWHDGPVHVIGSVIADFLMPEADLTEDGQQQPKVVFWGCGVRDENGLSEDRIHRAKILAVRGPKTASVLKLGAATPQGDIAFFLPALYAPRRLRLTAGKSICIPHFWDRRPDGDFADAGCDVVLRTNIAAGPVQIRRVIDSIASADFVLTASLHGAVVAAAYGIPFAFWDNGHVDLPFKWEDFAAYLSIPNTFYTNLSDAKAGYDEEIRDRLKRPPLWAFLACAPFPIKPVAMAKIVGHLWSSSGASEAEATLQDLLDEFEHATVEKDVAANAFMDQVAALNDAVASGRAELARAEEETLRLIRLKDDVGGVADAQEKSLRERDEEIAALKDGLAKVEATHAEFRTSANARVDALEHENASLNDEVEARAGALAEAKQALTALQEATSSANARVAALEHENASLNDEVEARAGALAEAKQALTALQEATSSANARVAALEHENASLNDEVGARAGALAEAQQDLAALQEAASSANARVAAFEYENACLKDEVAAHASVLAETQQAVTALREATDHAAELDAALGAAQDQLTEFKGRLSAAESQAQSLAAEVLDAREQATAAASNLERLSELASGLRNDPEAFEGGGFDDPADMQALFQNVAVAIGGLKRQRGIDAEALERQRDQNHKLIEDAKAAWSQAADAREKLRLLSTQIVEDNTVRTSLTSRLDETRRDLERVLGERSALETLAVEQDRLLAEAQANVAALSRQVQIAGHEAEILRRRAEDAEALRQSAQRRYEKISGSVTWTLVRRTRKIREYFSPHRLKQRGRRIIRVLTGKRKKRPSVSTQIAITAAAPSPHPPASTPDLTVFIVTLERQASTKASENVARIAESGAQIILCGDVANWAGSRYITVPSAAANVIDHIDHHLRTSASATTVIVFGAETQVSGDLGTFPELFSANPLMVVCGALEVDHEDRVVAAGATRNQNGDLVPLNVGQPMTDFRVASVHSTEFLWPLVVAVDTDGFRHLGGLGVGSSGEAALLALAVEARRRGLEVGVNPFVQAIRSDSLRPIQLNAGVEKTAGALVHTHKPKVLFTDALTPTPDRDSGSIDIYWYMRIFLELGYEVTFLPVQDLKHAGRYTRALQMLGIRCPLEGDVDQPWMFLRDFGSEFDLVMTYRASSACHVIDPIREFAPNARVVFDTVDLHFLREHRAAELSGSPEDMEHALRTRVEELKVMTLSDATILLSSLEYDYIGEISPETRRYLISIVRDVPGVGAPAAGRRGAMFVGGFKHAPNTDAAVFLCSEIWPRVRSRDPLAELSIIGADVSPEIQALHNPSQGINIVGFVEDLDPFYKSMRVNLAPLRYGAGVKGKVAASLSVGLPTVATPTAVEGMFLEDGRDVLVCEDPEAFAEAVVRLFRDDVLWERLSCNAVKAAQDTFSIDAARSRLKTMLVDLGLPTE